MSTLLDSVKSYLTPDLIGKISALLDENDSAVAKASTGYAASILGGFAAKSHDQSFTDSAFHLLNNSKVASVLDTPATLVKHGNLAHDDPKDVSGKLLGSLFGGKVQDLISGIASFAGLKHQSSSTLLGIIGPMVMAFLSKKIVSGKLSAHSFSNMLSNEKSGLMSAIPAGLASSLGFAPATTAPMHTVSELPEPARRSNWLWPLIILFALLFAFLYWRGCGNNSTDTVAPGIDTVASVNVPDGYNKKLNSGVEIKGNMGGMEEKLIAFIESDNPVDKTTWFSFDRITFRTDSDDLDMEKSQDQLKNIAEILRAYPAVKLKVGGYTDSTGNESHNMTLSQNRADAVVAALTNMGIDADRLSPEGYGSQYPVGSNETAEGRAQNRRIDVRVMEK